MHNYLMHVGNENSGRYRRGSGERPYQHVANKFLARNIKGGKDKPLTSLAEKTVNDAQKGVVAGKQAVKTFDKVKNKKKREQKYLEAAEKVSKMSDQEIRDIVNRKNLEKSYIDSLDINTLTKGEQKALDILDVTGDIVGVLGGVVGIAAGLYALKHSANGSE